MIRVPETEGVVHHARIHFVIGSDDAISAAIVGIDLTVVAPIGGPACWVSGLLGDVIDEEVSVGVDICRKPVRSGERGDRADVGGGGNADRATVNGAAGWGGEGSVEGVADLGIGRVREDLKLEGVVVEAAVCREPRILDDPGSAGAIGRTRAGVCEVGKATAIDAAV